jgi:hypothetical protein
MERKLPADYEGWQVHEPAFRRMTTPELVQEIQDGAPERRLAALSVIDLADVAHATIEDWVRSLPDPEANELAGAIPAQSAQATCEDDVFWVDLASMGYELRRLPTFLVMLFSSLEAMDARQCPQSGEAWVRTGAWLIRIYNSFADEDDTESPSRSLSSRTTWTASLSSTPSARSWKSTSPSPSA